MSQRTWGVLLVLCLLVIVPYWMAKKVNNKTAAEVAADKGTQPTPTLATSPAPSVPPGGDAAPSAVSTAVAVNPDRFGLSFGHGALPSTSTSLMYSACAGAPLDMGNPDKDQCNPYQGDTSCRTALPILCTLKDGSTAESAGLTQPEAGAVGFNFYAGWVGGSLGATAPVAGFVIDSLAQAHARCASELGAGWRMAEFQDVGGGWGLVGKRGQGLTSTHTRHWVAINNQPSNCWDPS